jgi:hypothetical protein
MLGTWASLRAIGVYRQSLGRRLDRALPTLSAVHPEARRGTRVNLGIQTIEVASIAGTAVDGGTQRRRDFLPIPELRNIGWRSRWQRLQRAGAQLVALPPIEVYQVGDEYWVIDGHHRVALALELGQWFIDADVTAIRWRGGPTSETVASELGSVLAASSTFRAAVA